MLALLRSLRGDRAFICLDTEDDDAWYAGPWMRVRTYGPVTDDHLRDFVAKQSGARPEDLYVGRTAA